MIEENLVEKTGEFKTSKKFLEFVGNKGQVNIHSKEATIEGKFLSGLGFDGITFKLTIFDDGTVNFDQVDGESVSKEQRSRLLEMIEDRELKPLGKKMVISDLQFWSTKELSGKKIPLFLEAEHKKPISVLASVLEGGKVEVTENQNEKINFLMSLFGDESEVEVVDLGEQSNPEKVEVSDWRREAEESFRKAKEEKLNELISKRETKLKEMFSWQRDLDVAKKSIQECKSEIELLDSRIETLQPELAENGYIFFVSEVLNQKVELDPEVEKVIREKVSGVKGINLENFMKLFEGGEHQIRLSQKVDGELKEVEDYEKLPEEIVNILKNSDLELIISDGKLIYKGDKAWSEVVNKMIKLGFVEDPDWNKFCGSNSY